MSQQWVIRSTESFDGLALEEASIPQPKDHEVLVKIYAVSLNWRDVMIATVSLPWSTYCVSSEIDGFRVPTCTQRKTKLFHGM